MVWTSWAIRQSIASRSKAHTPRRAPATRRRDARSCRAGRPLQRRKPLILPVETQRSILDAITGQVRRLQGDLGVKDRNRVAEYLDATSKQGYTPLDVAMGKTIVAQLPVAQESTVALLKKLGGTEGPGPRGGTRPPAAQ